MLRELDSLCQGHNQRTLSLDWHAPFGRMDLSVDLIDKLFGQVGRVARCVGEALASRCYSQKTTNSSMKPLTQSRVVCRWR